MSEAVLVVGGVRSGKSAHAQTLAEKHHGPLAYVATAQAFDEEMANRIARHQADRGPRWCTFEAPLELPAMLENIGPDYGAVLVDCLTLWLSNIMLAERNVAIAGDELVQAITRCPRPVVLVANEVGMGIVPTNALARAFRDEAGMLNQKIARHCCSVVLTVAGIPLQIK